MECNHPYAALTATALGKLFCRKCSTPLDMPKVSGRYSTSDRRPGVPVKVTTQRINTANRQITAAMVARWASKNYGWGDPCIICGVTFRDCPHDVGETWVTFKQIKAMTKQERERILNG